MTENTYLVEARLKFSRNWTKIHKFNDKFSKITFTVSRKVKDSRKPTFEESPAFEETNNFTTIKPNARASIFATQYRRRGPARDTISWQMTGHLKPLK